MALLRSLDSGFQASYPLPVLSRIGLPELKKQVEQPFLSIDQLHTIVRRSHLPELPTRTIPYKMLTLGTRRPLPAFQMILSVRCRTLKYPELWYGRVLR
jgi:hypothetical protein